MKKRAVAALLAVMMSLSVTACGSRNETEDVSVVSVSGILPESGDVIVTNTYIGTVSPQESLTIYPMASGNVTEVHTSVGAEVKQGDVLFQLDSSEADREIEEAEEMLEKAEALAKQAEEDAKELEEALEKVDQAEAKADLESQIEAKEKEVAGYKTAYETEKTEYDNLDAEYKKYNYTSGTKTDERWEKEVSTAKKEALDFQKEIYELKKSIHDTANKELEDLKKQLSAASTTSTTTSSSTTTTSSSATTSSTEKDSKDTTETTITVETTVYEQMVEDAKEVLEKAKEKLADYQITAPIEGIIEAMYLEVNEKAFEDEACLVLSNKSNIEVTFQVPEEAALALKVGDQVIVEKNGGMNQASITEVSLMADEQTKLFSVKASMGAVSGFSTGTDVKVYADTKKEENVLRIPYDALYFQRGNAYVYCAEDDEAVRREVQVGLMNEEYAQILDGLTEEDIVISTWSSQLKDGADINLLFVIGGNSLEEEDEEAGETDEDILTEETSEETETDAEEEYQWQLPDLD